MKMSRIDRKIRTWDVTNTLANGVPASIPGVDIALLAPRTSPTLALAPSWVASTYSSVTGKATILLAGPEADSTGALVVPATADLWMRVTDAPEVEAIFVERITVLGGGAVLPLPPLYVASVVGATGVVTGTQIATDPALKATYGLVVVATVTASATLAAGKFTPVDATAAARTMTLPTGAGDGVGLGVEKVDSSTNTVTITGSIRGATTTITLPWQHETLLLRADDTGSWWPVAGHKTKASLDSAYGHVVRGPTLPTLPTGEYVWFKTNGTGTLLDIITGVA